MALNNDSETFIQKIFKEWNDHLPKIILFEYVIMIISQFTAVFCFGLLLYWNFQRKDHRTLGLTIAMHFYILAEFIFNIGCMPYVIYLIAFWEPINGSYNAFYIFWTGAIQTLLLINLPVTVFFLGFDRCCCILAPIKNRKIWEKIAFILTLITMAIFVAIAIPFHVLPGFPITPETICRSFGCLAPNWAGAIYSIFRYVTSIGNVFISLILVKLVKKQTALNSKSFKYTRLTLITVFMTVLLDFFPHLIAFSLNTFLEINLTKVIGPYSLLVSSMNSGICGIIYYNTWRKLTINANQLHCVTQFIGKSSRDTVSHLQQSAIVVASTREHGRTFSRA